MYYAILILLVVIVLASFQLSRFGWVTRSAPVRKILWGIHFSTYVFTLPFIGYFFFVDISFRKEWMNPVGIFLPCITFLLLSPFVYSAAKRWKKYYLTGMYILAFSLPAFFSIPFVGWNGFYQVYNIDTKVYFENERYLVQSSFYGIMAANPPDLYVKTGRIFKLKLSHKIPCEHGGRNGPKTVDFRESKNTLVLYYKNENDSVFCTYTFNRP